MNQGANILVADDEPGQRTVLEFLLSADGHRVMSVEDGKEALDYLKLYTPDLVVLDVRMPMVSGLDICSRIKRMKRFKDVPVIILTGLRDERTKTEAKIARADAVVHKPLMGQDFGQLVQSLLDKAKAYPA